MLSRGDALLWLQKWRHYQQPCLPWNRALLHLERGEHALAIGRAREAHDHARQHKYTSIASYARVIECRAYLAEHPVDREELSSVSRAHNAQWG